MSYDARFYDRPLLVLMVKREQKRIASLRRRVIIHPRPGVIVYVRETRSDPRLFSGTNQHGLLKALLSLIRRISSIPRYVTSFVIAFITESVDIVLLEGIRFFKNPGRLYKTVDLFWQLQI